MLDISFMDSHPKSPQIFPPGAWCAIWIVSFLMFGIIGGSLSWRNPEAFNVITIIGALFFIAIIPICIVGYIKLKEKQRELMKQGVYISPKAARKARVAERRASRKQARMMARQQKHGVSTYTNPSKTLVAPTYKSTVASNPVPSNSQQTPVVPAPKPVLSQSASTAPVVTPTKRLPNVYMPQTATTVLVPEEVKRIAVQLVDDIRPSSIKAKSPKKAGAHVEQAAEPLPFDAATEQEVNVQEQKFTCVVHKGPITGANYLCSKCGTFYCLNCAIALKKNQEKCWTCGAELTVDLPDSD